MDVPHSPQNLNWGGLANPHLGHDAVTGVPHSPQNFRPSGLSKPELGQRMGAPSWAAVSALGACVCRRWHGGRKYDAMGL